jgi:hypothetical protein
VCGADFGVLPRVGSGLLSGAEVRAKSLSDGHIDGRVVFGIECRSHPRIDPLLPARVSGRAPGHKVAPGQNQRNPSAILASGGR